MSGNLGVIGDLDKGMQKPLTILSVFHIIRLCGVFLKRYCNNCSEEFDGSLETCPVCGSPLLLKNNSLFQERYRVVRCLSATLFSHIYLAQDQNMGNRDVVLKVLFKDDTQRDQADELKTREERIAAKVIHPNLVTIYDSGLSDYMEPYLVMEYLSGPTLADLIRKEGRIDFVRAARIMTQVCDALSALHRGGFVHKDLKAENIVLVDYDKSGRESVKLLDFGISQEINPPPGGGKTGGRIMGTQSTMSPEQTHKSIVGPRSDIYSAGMLMYEMLVGRPAFSMSRSSFIEAHRKHTPQSLRLQGLMDLPVAVDDLILQMISKNENQRPADCLEVRNRLNRVLNPWRRSDSETIQVDGNREAQTELTLGDANNIVLRQTEMRHVLSTLSGMLEGRAVVWHITGDEGMGKTWLLNSIARKAGRVSQNMAVHVFSFLGGDYPLEVLKTLVQGILECKDDKGQDISEIHECLQQTFKHAGCRYPKELARQVVTLMFNPQDILKLGKIHTSLVENYMFTSIYQVIKAYSKLKPLFLGFDDVHKYGTMFRRFIDFLQVRLAQGDGIPATLLIAGESLQNSAGENDMENVRHLELRPLDAEQLEPFVKAILGFEVRPNLVKEITRMTGGNPGVTLEYCRHINNLKGFVVQDGVVDVKNRHVLESIPALLEKRLKFQLDALAEEGSMGLQALEILRRIALAGNSITRAILTRILSEEGRMDLKFRMEMLIDYLVQKGLVIAGCMGAEDCLMLAHPGMELVLWKREQAKPHPEIMIAVASVLESLPGQRLSEHYGRIAMLYEWAGYLGKAADYHILMARQAYGRFVFQDAVKEYRKARILLQGLGMQGSKKWVLMSHELGCVLSGMGMYREALDAYDMKPSVLALKQATPDELNRWLEFTHILVELHRTRDAVTMLKALIRKFKDTQAPLMEAECHLMLATIHMRSGSINAGAKEVAIAQNLLEGQPVSPVHYRLALRRVDLALGKGDFSDAVSVLRNTLKHLSHPMYYTLKSETLYYQGKAFLGEGMIDEARDSFQEGLELSRRYSYYKGIAMHKLDLAAIHTYLGKTEGLEREIQDILKNSKAAGDPLVDVIVHNTLSRIYIFQHQWDQAWSTTNKAFTLSRQYKYAFGEGVAALHRAILEVNAGDFNAAEHSMAIVKKRLGMPTNRPEDTGFHYMLAPTIFYVQGRLRLYHGDATQGFGLMQKSIELYRRLKWHGFADRIQSIMDGLRHANRGARVP